MVAVLRSWVRSALLVALLPVVILASTDSAHAASVYTDPVTVQVHVNDFRPGYDSECSVGGFYGLTDDMTQSVHMSFRCAWGWMMTSVESPDMSAVLTLTGVGCTASASFPDVDENTQYSAAPGVGYGCHITSGCLQLDRDVPILADQDWTECFDLDLGPVEDTGASACPNATPVGAPEAHFENSSGLQGSQGYQQLKGSITFNATAAGGTVYMITWYNYPGGLPSSPSHSTTSIGYSAGTQTKTWNIGPSFQNSKPMTVLGVQMIFVSPNLNVTGKWESGNSYRQYWNYDPVRYFPTSGTDKDMGAVTWPERCSFYFGTKLANTPSDDYDEPVGPIQGQPGEEPPVLDPVPDPPGASSCNFSWSDPSSWATAGICALVELFGRALDLLAGVLSFLGGLVAKLGDLLTGLLVPSPGFMEGKADQIKDAWDSTPPMVFLNGVQDVGNAFVIPGPSGCTGPALTFTSPVGHEPVTVHPMSACDAGMANLASLVKIALTVLVYVGGFLASVRIVGAAFGVDASIGRGDDA